MSRARWTVISTRIRVAVVCSLAATLLAVAPSVASAGHSRRNSLRHRPHRIGARAAHHRGPRSRARVSQQCPAADAAVSSAPAVLMRAAVACLVNQKRAALGLPGLKASARLNRVAQLQTQAMVATGAFSHGPNFTLRFSAGGYNWQAAGENIATGYVTPRSVVDAWMASPGHCRNILDPAFRDLGIGVTATPVGRSTPPGTWTEDFGLLMSQSAPSSNTQPQSGCPY